MTYNEALDYIHSRYRPSSRIPGLERFKKLMNKLANPQNHLSFVHIAGSSGKGSTAVMTESILRHAGKKTGLFISPFVFDFRERIQINGAFVEKDVLVHALQSIIPALDEMKNEGSECTEFDVVTALALVIFKRLRCDIVVLEVGIGGLTDRTNIIPPPLVAAICSISLEHTEILGTTIKEIALQKSGIIKKGSRVAAYCLLKEEAQNVVKNTCKKYGISPRFGDISALKIEKMSLLGSVFTYKNHQYSISLSGEHQIYNAITAISIVEELRLAGLDITQDALEKGLKNTTFVGRLQVVRQSPLCVIDGAHNPEKIDSLCKAVDSLFPNKKIISVMGMKALKDFEQCIPQIAKRSRIFIAITPNDMGPRALPASVAAEVARPHCPDVRIEESAFEAGRLAVSLAEDDDLVLACGSIYIIGDAKSGFEAL